MAKKAMNVLAVVKPVVKSVPAPRRGCAKGKWRPFYNAAAVLRPGEFFEWFGAPVYVTSLVKKWAERLNCKELYSYRDIDGNVIVRRRGDEDFIEDGDEGDEEARDSEFAGGEDEDEPDEE